MKLREWSGAREEHVGQTAEGPDVALREGRLAVEDLGRGERQVGAVLLDDGALLGDAPGAAKVAQLHVEAARRGEQHVVRLQVEVSEAAPVQVLQAVQHLFKNNSVILNV